jgi:hypothetical protein
LLWAVDPALNPIAQFLQLPILVTLIINKDVFYLVHPRNFILGSIYIQRHRLIVFTDVIVISNHIYFDIILNQSLFSHFIVLIHINQNPPWIVICFFLLFWAICLIIFKGPWSYIIFVIIHRCFLILPKYTMLQVKAHPLLKIR